MLLQQQALLWPIWFEFWGNARIGFLRAIVMIHHCVLAGGP